MDWMAVVIADPVKAMLIKIWGYVPALVGALVILIVGWFIAKLVEAVLVRILKAVRLDVASDKAGISNILAQGDIKMSLSELLGVIVYWLVVLIVIATALNALNLAIAADIVSKLVEYVPNILGAVFILVIGSLLASFLSTIVRTAASNAGLEKAKLLAQITQTVLVVFAALIAIEQLGIATALIALAVNVVLASVGLGIALAFGLGCKDIAGKAVSDLLNKIKR